MNIMPMIAAQPNCADWLIAALIFFIFFVGSVGNHIVCDNTPLLKLRPNLRTSNIAFRIHVWHENGAGPQQVTFAFDGFEDIQSFIPYSVVYLVRRQREG